jgi:predicted neutral ceramidase superfamily lipid hydrolase
MERRNKPIEEFFFESMMKLSFISILIVIAVDIYFIRFTVIRSLIVNFSVLFAITAAFVFYKKGFFKTSVLLMAFLIMGAMFYQSIQATMITTSSMAVVMVIGFGFSVLLKGKLPFYMHALTLSGMLAVFSWLAMHPHDYGEADASNIIVAGVTYLVLYSIIAYSSLMLKQRYDDAFETLAIQNLELIEKSNEIETQNEELTQSQENLFQLNAHLEQLVEERTRKIHEQNEKLLAYAYSNAHHLRGPVARVLGLISLSKLEAKVDYPFLFQKIEEQTNEIDGVIKTINRDLETQ